MKTSTTAPTRPSTPVGARLRRLAVVGLVAPVVALAACSGESPVTADPTTAGGTTAPSTAAETTTQTDATTTAPATSAPAKRVDKDIKVSFTDSVLGHSITATRVSRNLPWPQGNPVAEQQFELVGVRLTIKAGTRYSAGVYPSMFGLKVGTAAEVPATDEFARLGSTFTPVPRGQTRSGWVFFKVDRGWDGQALLVFNRPAYDVKTTGQDIPAKAFRIKVWG